MPLTKTTQPETDVEFDEALIVGEDGQPTLAAETMAVFLEDVDYSALFDDPDLAEGIDRVELAFKESTEEGSNLLIPVFDKELGEYQWPEAEDAEVPYLAMECRVLPGELVAEVIDMDDLMAMFEHFIVFEHPVESMVDKAIMAEFADMFDDYEEADLDEAKRPFKKGDFRKGPMSKVSGASSGGKKKVHNQRVRMMQAMMKKGAIVRVAKGSGYKGGDYKYGASKSGSPTGKKMYAKVAAKNAKRASNIAKMVTPGRKKIIKVIYKNLGGKMPSPWIPPEKRVMRKGKKVKGGSKAAASKKGAAKKKAAAKFGKKKKGKSIAASFQASAEKTVDESVRLAGAAMHGGRSSDRTTLAEVQNAEV